MEIVDGLDEVFGRPLLYKDHHVDEKHLDSMRLLHDRIGDDCVEALRERNQDLNEFIDKIGNVKLGDALSLPNFECSDVDVRIAAFVEHVCTVPSWVDWGKIRRGQDVFYRNHAFASLALLYFSLVGGFAAPKITKVLEATSYLTRGCSSTWRRLNETLVMVLDCLEYPDSMRIGGKGWASVLKVRFLHSRVRLRLLGQLAWPSGSSLEQTKGPSSSQCPYNFDSFNNPITDVDTASKDTNNGQCPINHNDMSPIGVELLRDTSVVAAAAAQDRSDQRIPWDIKTFGVPINQEDMIATQCAFSANVLEVISANTWPPLCAEDEEAYIHLWRYIGYLIGIQEEYNVCTDTLRAKGATESVVLHLLHPDDSSRNIATHVLRSVTGRPPMASWPYETHCEVARALIGDPLSDALSIAHGSIFQRMYVRCILKTISVVNVLLSPWMKPGSVLFNGVKKGLRRRVMNALAFH